MLIKVCRLVAESLVDMPTTTLCEADGLLLWQAERMAKKRKTGRVLILDTL